MESIPDSYFILFLLIAFFYFFPKQFESLILTIQVIIAYINYAFWYAVNWICDAVGWRE